MSAFDLQAVDRLGGPEWLRAMRPGAADAAVAAGLPTVEEEMWRYSRIGEFRPGAFRPAVEPGPVPAIGELPSAVGASAVVVVVDGHLVHAESHVAGLEVGVLDDAALFGSVLRDAGDAFAAWNSALVPAPVVVRVRRGLTVPGPVVVLHHVASDGVAAFARLVVDAGEDADVTVLDRQASADVAALSCPVVELRASQAARLRYLAVNELGARVWQIGTLVAEAERDATTVLAAVALGGDYARQRIDSRLVGAGATGQQVAVYFGEADQMHDFRTLSDHVAPKTSADLLFKGAVEDRARSVYTGLIKVRPEARGTVAFQTNRNITLSEHAWAESVPNLEIETNDVKCSHASAVGPIDEDQRFYLESRGVPPAVAERLIVLGFFDEVLGQLPVPAIAGALRAQVAAKLDRRTP